MRFPFHDKLFERVQILPLQIRLVLSSTIQSFCDVTQTEMIDKLAVSVNERRVAGLKF